MVRCRSNVSSIEGIRLSLGLGSPIIDLRERKAVLVICFIDEYAGYH